MNYNEGIQKLRDLHINTAEVICSFPKADSKEKAEQYHAVVLATLDRLSCPLVVRTEGRTGVWPIYPEDFYPFMRQFLNEESYITIFKAPSSRIALQGICVPSPHYNRFRSVSDFESQPRQAVTVWGQPLDEFPFPVGIRKPIALVNEMLSPRRMELDGAELEFTYHTVPEGELQHNIVFWGIKSPDYKE